MTTKRAGGLPFSNPVIDSFELMKKMWGFAGLPGLPTPTGLASMAARIPQQLPSMLAPTLDVNELEKRIADLRAVEQWLELNAGMLRTTIQSLEVQRATIATLKGITGAMMAPMLPKADPPTAQPPEVALGLAALKEDESKHTLPPVAEPGPRAGTKTGRRTKQSPPPVLAATALNPVAWWNTLQDQFLRVSASAADATAQDTKTAKSSDAKPRRRAAKARRNKA
jgi:hypothetical protein